MSHVRRWSAVFSYNPALERINCLAPSHSFASHDTTRDNTPQHATTRHNTLQRRGRRRRRRRLTPNSLMSHGREAATTRRDATERSTGNFLSAANPLSRLYYFPVVLFPQPHATTRHNTPQHATTRYNDAADADADAD
jgi:hypothetical protein